MQLYRLSDIVASGEVIFYTEDMSECILGFIDQWGELNSRRDDIPA